MKKEDKIPTLDMEETLAEIEALDSVGAQQNGEMELNEMEEEADEATRYYVNDLTSKDIFGPFDTYDEAYEAAEGRKEAYPDHHIIIQQIGVAEEAAGAPDVLVDKWRVKDYTNGRSYGPYYSKETARGVMSRLRKRYPTHEFGIIYVGSDRSDSLEAESNENDNVVTTKAISVRISIAAQGLGSFRAGRLNTANGDSGGFFPAGSTIALRARAASGHKFSHWTFNGNFGGDKPSRSIRVQAGLSIVGFFVPEKG